MPSRLVLFSVTFASAFCYMSLCLRAFPPRGLFRTVTAFPGTTYTVFRGRRGGLLFLSLFLDRGVLPQEPTSGLSHVFLAEGWGTAVITLRQHTITLWPDLEPASAVSHVEKREKLNRIWGLLKSSGKAGGNSCSECNPILPRLELAKGYSSYLLYMWV